MALAESRTVNVVWKLMPNEHHFFLWMFILSWIQATVGTISSEHSVNWKKKKLDLLSQRGRAMLRVCIASIQRRAQSFIISCFGFRYTIIIIIIIMWLVLWWTLPFLRACSMLADSELGDRKLSDQCSGAPGQIQWSVTKCVVVGPSDGASPLAEGSRWPEGQLLLW